MSSTPQLWRWALSSDHPPPALSDARGLGGIIAQGGFDYQLWDGLARLPAWLVNPAFEGMIFEGLEDLEARFFAPQAPQKRLLERYQAKSGSLTPSELRDILESFHSFETAYPQVARVQTLVTPRLPSTLGWLGRDPARVRRARPFYAPFTDITAASDARLRKRLVDTYGDALGSFVAESVEFRERNLPDHEGALAVFNIELDRVFPTLNASSRCAAAGFEALCSFVRQSIGTPLSRESLARALETGLGKSLPLSLPFPLHIRSDRGEVNEAALEIDASAFSLSLGSYPEPERWRDELAVPLIKTAQWLNARSINRVRLGGSYRLTTGMIMGWALRAASGFELEISTRDRLWLTDDRPQSDYEARGWCIEEPSSLHGEHLVVAIGILRDPAADLRKTAGVASDAVLRFHYAMPIANSRAAQAGASAIKSAIDAAVARLRPKAIEMYIAGPAAFAVVLGHRWNGMPPTQLHEFNAVEQRYVPTVSV